MVLIDSYGMHRRADLFPAPLEFHPSRFLTNRPVDSPQTFDIPGDAWRPFEKGPRACIGQELALLEIKIIMILTLTQFDITAEYDEWDRAHGKKPGPGVDGFRAYQTLVSSSKPVDDMPSRVKRR